MIFDVGGQRTERIISYNNGEAKVLHENISGREYNVVNKVAQNNEIIGISKNKKLLWTILSVVSILIVGGGTIAFCNRETMSVEQETDSKHEYGTSKECKPVDLGLTSGTMWADRNVGASTASDFGDLYAWGEVTKKKDYSQGMYNSTDKPHSNITSAKNDVAKSILGEDWATPTEKQFKELLSECQWEWIQIEGHYGFKIIGKNGNHIFLPAAGWICSTKADYQNKYGYYWTSERATSNPQFARSLQFPRDGKGIIGNGYLYYGRSIRAVYVIAAAAE